MRKLTAIISGVVVVGVLAGGVGGVSVLRAREQAPQLEAGADDRTVPVMDVPVAATPSATPTPGVTGNSDSILSENNVKTTTNNANSKPGTALAASTTTGGSGNNFAQYEQYKGSDSAMYQEQVVGSGAAVASGSVGTVNYRGYLTNGQVFDDSYAKGKPLVVTIGQHTVIPGFEEGLVGMKTGGKRRIIIPPALGYGDSTGGPVPAGSVLVFDVEVMSIQ